MSILRWLSRWGWLLILAAGTVFCWILFRQGPGPKERLHTELKAIDAGEATRITLIDEGEAAALEKVERDYADTIGNLDAAELARAKNLRRNPVRLARHLDRLSRGR
jgi:hypothetical protein